MNLVQPLLDEAAMEERSENFSNSARQLQLVRKDSSQLSLAELADAINQSHCFCQEKYKSSLLEARKAGEFLLIAKAKVKELPSGRWLPWLSEKCPDIPDRTARAYMQVARDWEEIEKTATVADFGLKKALKALAESKGTKEPTTDESQAKSIQAQTTEDSFTVIDAEWTKTQEESDRPKLEKEPNPQDKIPEAETEKEHDPVAPTYTQPVVVTTKVTVTLVNNANLFSDEQIKTIFDALYSRFKRIGVVG